MHWIALQPTPEPAGAEKSAERGVPQAAAPLADACTAWAWWALQFTPLVARVEAALLLEVSASERLFGGPAALLAELLHPQWFERNTSLAPVEYAQGATSLVAYGRLQCALARTDSGAATYVDNHATTTTYAATYASTYADNHTTTCANPCADTPPGAAIPADALPLYTLAAARAHLPTLVRLGLTNWGQLRALPRGGLVRRFGAGLVDALDCAYGQRAEVYPWLTLPEVFDAPLELAASVETATALLFGARRLLAQLQVWLRARQRGVLALELLWELDARRSNALHVDAHHSGGAQGRLELRTAQATQDMVHLARLLGEQLARVTLPAPVLYLRLRSLRTQPLAGESASLLPDDVRVGDSLHQLLERLSARLGPQQVRSAILHADHRPEHMQHWVAALDRPPVGKTRGQAGAIKEVAASAHFTGASAYFGSKESPDYALYPSWLLATPLRLTVQQGQPQYRGPLALLAGPQRLESGWLEGGAHCALRDYYVARSAAAGLVWVYRERLGAQACWYLHGLFA